MTTPQQPVPPVDTGNTLLTQQPAHLVTTLVEVGGGQRLAMTIRTPSTTPTVLLEKADADTWAANLTKTAKLMSASGLIVGGNGMVPKGHG
ncbi:MAG TPA: hypothetical protein VGS19_23865 [Streptosporangiaceae bacterium]|nr:hypothetical protein [Streptosporangiaceae bacterium]